MDEIIQTKEQTIFQTPGKWLEVIKTPLGFYYSRRKGKDSVAVFLWRLIDPSLKYELSNIEILIRYQPLPIHNADLEYEQTLYPCPVTGGLEANEDPRDCAVREVLEETGYEITQWGLRAIDKYIVGTQTDEQVYLYSAQVSSNEIPKPAIQDGSYFESISQNKWVPFEQLKDFHYSACRIFFYFMICKVSYSSATTRASELYELLHREF